jgi:hypothetical protein
MNDVNGTLNPTEPGELDHKLFHEMLLELVF